MINSCMVAAEVRFLLLIILMIGMPNQPSIYKAGINALLKIFLPLSLNNSGFKSDLINLSYLASGLIETSFK